MKKWISFLPGQYAAMTLDAPDDPRKAFRYFSISSSPTEKGRLLFTTKISQSPFKQKLASMKPGEKADIRWPYGDFVLHEDYSRPAVMLSGGIGITPLRSMARFATDRKLPLKITLLYSCRTSEEMVYAREMRELERGNPDFKFVPTITRPEESEIKWGGRVGRIDGKMLREFMLPGAVYYVCGPPAMVTTMTELVLSLE